MVKIENLVAPVSVKTENVFQSEPNSFERNNSKIPKNNFNHEAETNLKKCSEIDARYSESESSPGSESFKENFRFDPKQESALEGVIHSASLSNLPLNIKEARKRETTALVPLFHPAIVVKTEKTCHPQSPVMSTEKNFKFLSYPNTYDTLQDVRESNAPSILKLVKTEGNICESDNISKGPILKLDRPFKYPTHSVCLSSLGIKPCWVVIERVDIDKFHDIKTSELLTCDNIRTNTIQDEVSYHRQSRCRVVRDNKAQNDLVHDNTTNQGTCGGNVINDMAHDDSMTFKNVTDSVKSEICSLVAPLPDSCIKVEKEEGLVCFPFYEVSCFSYHDNKMQNSAISDNKIHNDNNVKSEISLLVAPAFPDKRFKVEKNEFSSLPAYSEVSHDNKLYEKMICDNEYHDNKVCEKIICDIKNHDNNIVKCEPSVLVGPFLPGGRIKVEKEEEFSSPLQSSEVLHDNKMHENVICDNNAMNLEICAVTSSSDRNSRIDARKQAFSSFSSSSEGPLTSALDNKVHDNTTCDIMSRHNNALKCEISTLVAPFFSNGCIKVEKERELSNSLSSPKVCHKYEIDDNVILEKKIHDSEEHDKMICDNNMRDNMICETDIYDNIVRDVVIFDNKILDNKVNDTMICDNNSDKCEASLVAPYFSARRTEAEKNQDFPALLSSSEVFHDNKTFGFCEDNNPDNMVCAAPDVSELRCERCCSSFTRKEYLKRHVEYHCNGPPLAVKNVTDCHGYASRNLRRADGLEERRPQCKDCGKYFSRPDALKKHASRAHSKPKVKKVTTKKNVLKCDHCDKSFPFKSRLQSHLQYHGKICQSRVCHTCNASFQDSYSYNRHMRWAHAPSVVKVGKCEGCGKVFARFRDLNKHLKRPGINNDEFFALVPAEALNQLTCNFCAKAFAKLEFLKCHLLRRLQKSAQVCGLCCAVFEGPEGLREHLRCVHQTDGAFGESLSSVGGKPAAIKYTCQHCGRSFRVKGCLRNHIFKRCVSVRTVVAL